MILNKNFIYNDCMAVGPANTEGVSIGKSSLSSLRELGARVVNRFRLSTNNVKANNESAIAPKVEIPEVKTIRELKAEFNIIPGSGYDILIDECQGNKPENIPDPTANELGRLYQDLVSFTDNPEVLSRLNDGDKDLIAEITGELVKKFLGKEKLSVVIDRLNKGQQTKPMDLKIVLANQLGRHMQELIRKEQARRVIEEQMDNKESVQVTGPAPVVSETVISQINETGSK